VPRSASPSCPQQTEGDLTADDIDACAFAAIVCGIQDIDVFGGLSPALAQLGSTVARKADQIEPRSQRRSLPPL